MKSCYQVLHNGFSHIDSITDETFLRDLREQGVSVDDEGIHVKTFGDNHEYDWYVFPIGEDQEGDEMAYIAIYKNGVRITDKIQIWLKNPQL